MHWQTSRFLLDLSRPQVMGIVNLTPDSFSDGGHCNDPARALARCEQLIRDGADLLDIGAESSRPGATPLPLADELQRLLPVLREAVKLGLPISVDSYKAGVMQAALELGVDIINDIWALRQPQSQAVVLAHPSCGVCLMHMHGAPLTMQNAPMRGDCVAQTRDFLQQRAAQLQAAGLARTRICLDPGIGFGKTPAQNIALLAQQQTLVALGYPLLLGWSRKSTLAVLSATPGTDPARLDNAARLAPSITAALLAVQLGAHVLRVHDVAETVAALKVWHAVSLAGLTQNHVGRRQD